MNYQATLAVTPDNTGNSCTRIEAVYRMEGKTRIGVNHAVEADMKRKRILWNLPMLKRIKMWMYVWIAYVGFELGIWQGRRAKKWRTPPGRECVECSEKDGAKRVVRSGSSQSGPLVAVIVPSLVVSEKQMVKLRRTLQCISQQTKKPHYTFLIDDASPIPIKSRLSAEEQDGVTFFRLGKNSGPAAARNLGLKAARESSVDFVCFTDSDCLPQPGWIEGFLNYFWCNPGVGILSGDTRAYPMSENGLSLYFANFGEWNGRVLPDGTLVFGATCNLAVRLDAVTFNFSAYFKEAAYEDVEFCVRARKEGVVIMKCAKSLVLHDCMNGAMGLFRQVNRYGRSHQQMLDLHPIYEELRRLSACYC